MIVLLPTVWVIGLLERMDRLQGLMSGLVGRQLTVTDDLRHAGRPALGALWLIAASSSPPHGSSLYVAEVHDALISTSPRDAASAG